MLLQNLRAFSTRVIEDTGSYVQVSLCTLWTKWLKFDATIQLSGERRPAIVAKRSFDFENYPGAPNISIPLRPANLHSGIQIKKIKKNHI